MIQKGGKNMKMKKHIMIIIMLLSIISSSLFGCQTTSNSNTNQKEVSGYSDKDIVIPDGLSRKQEQELKQIYKDSYEDEKKTLDIAVIEAIKNFDKYGQLKQDFKDMLGTTEEFYQALNDFDPNLKNVIADDIAFEYGNSPLEYYLIDKGIGTILDDNDTGKTIRSFIEYTGLAIMESFTIMSLENNQTTRKDALQPIVCGEEYALVRTLGTINEILNEIEINSCYRIAMNVFEQRQEAIKYLDAPLDEYLNSTDEELFHAWSKGQNFAGRQKALDDAIAEWDIALYEWKTTFLHSIGIKEMDVFIQKADEYDIKVTNHYGYETYDEYVEHKKSLKDEYEQLEDFNVEEYFDLLEKGKLGTQYIYSIIDKDGKVYGSFLSASAKVSAVMNNDGMCSLTALDRNNKPMTDKHVILDKHGNILFQNDEEPDKNGNQVLYEDVTASGNLLKKILKSDFEHGDYVILEFVTVNGKTKKLMEGGYIHLSKVSGYEDYYKFSCGYEDDRDSRTEGMIDMKTGDILTEEEYEEIYENSLKYEYAALGANIDMEALGSKDASNPLKKGTWLNANYVIYKDVIYDNTGEKIKTLDAGRGVENILYANDYYWIVSKTGWYYVLDNKFNQILEPVKFEENDNYLLTEYGLLIQSETINADGKRESEFTLYDENGKIIMELPLQINLRRNISEFIAGNEKVGWVNLNTKEMMLLSVPDEKLTVLSF